MDNPILDNLKHIGKGLQCLKITETLGFRYKYRNNQRTIMDLDPNKQVTTYNLDGEIVEPRKGPISLVKDSEMWTSGYYYDDHFVNSHGPYKSFTLAKIAYETYVNSDLGKVDEETCNQMCNKGNLMQTKVKQAVTIAVSYLNMCELFIVGTRTFLKKEKIINAACLIGEAMEETLEEYHESFETLDREFTEACDALNPQQEKEDDDINTILHDPKCICDICRNQRRKDRKNPNS